MPGSELYAYAVGRIRAMENKLFDRSLLERMIDAPSSPACLAMLAEAGYPSPEGSDVQAVRAYIKSLDNYELSIIHELKSFSPEPDLFDIFALKRDYFNVKILLKSVGKELAVQELRDGGVLSTKEIRKAFMDGDYSKLPANMQKVLSDAGKIIAQSANVQYADLLLDKAYFDDCRDLCKRAQRRDTRKFLKKFIDIEADLFDISTAMRIRKRGLQEEAAVTLMEKAYVPGALSQDDIIQMIRSDDANIRQYFEKTEYAKLISEGLNRYDITGSLSHLEKLCDDYIMAFLIEAGKNAFGIEALFAYFVGKEREITNIRFVLIGKLNNLQTNELRQRVRDLRVKK